MPYYRIVARYFAYAEQIVCADSIMEARCKATAEWPDGQWRSMYGGAELKPPDGSLMISHEAAELTEAETKRIEEHLPPDEY